MAKLLLYRIPAFVAPLPIIFSLILSSCGADYPTGSTPDLPYQDETAVSEKVGKADDNPVESPRAIFTTPTSKDNAIETDQEDQVDQLLDEFLKGKPVDVFALTSNDFAEFSHKLAEKRNADRGISPVILDNHNGNPAFIDKNFDMRPYDGHPDSDEVIELFMPVEGLDSQGKVQVMRDGKVLTIANSAGVDWNAVIRESHDSRIVWPKGSRGKSWTDNYPGFKWF